MDTDGRLHDGSSSAPDISLVLIHRYCWIRPHQFNGELAPAQAEEKLNVMSKWLYLVQTTRPSPSKSERLYLDCLLWRLDQVPSRRGTTTYIGTAVEI